MKTANYFLDSLFAAGAGAFLADELDTAKWLANEINAREIREVSPADYDFADICEILELTPANNPKRVYIAANYNQEPIYFALATDWDLA